MPTYVYACSACNSTFEVEQRITADPLDTCECGSKGTVKRVIQPVGIAFKGSGFHINDYSASTSGSDKKSDSKPEDAPIPAEPKTESLPKSEVTTPAPSASPDKGSTTTS